MKVTVEHNERVAKIVFASIYAHYVTNSAFQLNFVTLHPRRLSSKQNRK
mgnify:CR=1 FL=1